MNSSDLVIEMLAEREAALYDRIATLEGEIESYRELAQTAIQALADVTRQRDQARASNQRLVDENRHLREQHAVAA